MKNRKFVICHMVDMDYAVQPAAILQIIVSLAIFIHFDWYWWVHIGECVECVECVECYQYNSFVSFFFHRLEDVKHAHKVAQGRSAVSDFTGNIFKLMNAVIGEAGDHLSKLDHHEQEVATINPNEQPEFMHSMMFR